jgi:hypothetical protein
MAMEILAFVLIVLFIGALAISLGSDSRPYDNEPIRNI